MTGYSCDGDEDDINWETEDEQEIDNSPAVSSGPSYSKLFNHFLDMGFSVKLVCKAIREYGEDNADAVLNALLTYSALDNSPEMQLSVDPEQCVHNHVDYDQSWFGDDEINLGDKFDPDSNSDNEFSGEEHKLRCLADMGYSLDEAYTALERCGGNASIEELADMICAAQTAMADDEVLVDLPSGSKSSPRPLQKDKRRKRKNNNDERRRSKPKRSDEDDLYFRPLKPMIGFGIPTEPCPEIHRSLPEDAHCPPYFYFENVASTPKGVWNTISRFLYDIEPEFVDSKYFCAAARKRGYVHNLPIKNRFPLLPFPPRTIFEAFPLSKKWWPSWDPRTKLNCLLTSIGSAKLTEKIRQTMEYYNGKPPPHVQKSIIYECKKWNFVWVGKNKVAALEPDEMEMLLGFPKNHTRGGGTNRTERYKSLGNSFQVDTVAYHLSVLKSMYPNGINVLSLFSGIGGGEVALHRLGIPLKNVVSVDISETNRSIVATWWQQTNQKGNLIHIPDIQQLDAHRLEELMWTLGGFDLIIGGSPCNNLAGSNRVSRDGLEGKESSLFHDYVRILDLVKNFSRVKM